MTVALDGLLEAVTAIVRDAHPSRVSQLASRIRETVALAPTAMPHAWKIPSLPKDRLADLFDAWRATRLGVDELAGMLVGASYAYHEAKRAQSIELVWTGPSSELVATRKTEQALLEVIGSAQRELFLISFVAYDVPSISKALNRAIGKGVDVSVLLESSEKHGGGISVDAIGEMRRSLPEAQIYYWDKKQGDFAGGKVHGKAAVADGRACFVTSANLTGYAMEKNMELGVLIRGGDIPDQLHRHLNAMVTTRTLRLA